MTRRWSTVIAVGVVAIIGLAAVWAVMRPTAAAHTASAHVASPSHSPVASNPAANSHSASESHSSSAMHSASAAPTGTSSLYESTRDDLLAVLADRGPAAALTALERRIHSDPQVSGLCHAVAHDLGHAALARADGNAAVALRDRNDVCGGGYTHGIIEVALGNSKHPARDLLRVCAPSQDGSCFHGVGHGLMFATKMNVDRSLELCDRSPDDTLAHRCGEGVFMQLFSADLAAGHMGSAPPITTDQARSRCQSTRASYAANCWFYSPNVWLAEHPEDFSGAITWCADAGSSLGRSSCTRGVGSRTVKYHPDDLSVGERVCAEAGALTRDCVSGMASYWSVHWKGERSSADLCHRLERPRMRALCEDAT